MTASEKTGLEMYRRMLLIRVFDETACKLKARGDVPGAVHTTIGQEGAVVGACMALATDDYITGNHRSHGHPIGKGAAVGPLMAELLGKATGVCKGKGGSMHLADFKVGSLGESAIVGSGIPVATGAGLSSQVLDNGRVSLCFFGDGASNQGAFHESANLAAVWALPVIYFCENNQYAISTAARDAVAVRDIADRARAYDIPGVVADGQDVENVYEIVGQAVERARAGKGPTLVEAKTYRFREHAEGLSLAYRSEEEIQQWLARCPIDSYRTTLLARGVPAETLDEIESSARAEIAEAEAFALASDLPRPEDAYDDLYATPIDFTRA